MAVALRLQVRPLWFLFASMHIDGPRVFRFVLHPNRTVVLIAHRQSRVLFGS